MNWFHMRKAFTNYKTLKLKSREIHVKLETFHMEKNPGQIEYFDAFLDFVSTHLSFIIDDLTL